MVTVLAADCDICTARFVLDQLWPTLGETGDRITVLSPPELARRLPGLAAAGSPRFCAARLAVADLELQRNGVNFQVTDDVLLIPPAASHGLALEFVEAGLPA